MRPGARIGSILLAALGCASPAPRPPTAPPSAPGPACRGEALDGPWLIDSGAATLSCDDGTQVTVAAGGNIRIEGGAMVDGACRIPLAERSCTLVGAPGVACRDGDTPYTSREVTIARDPLGGVTIVYALEHPDPDKPGGKCVATTRGTLMRAARDATACGLDGRWEATTSADGKPARTSITIAGGQCTVVAPDARTTARCERKAGAITLTGGCRPGDAAAYTLTFAADCGALELEAQTDPCEARRSALEFLYLRRVSP